MITTDCWCWAQEEPELEQAVVARPAVDELESMMEEAAVAAAAAEDLRWHHRIPSSPRRKTYDVDNIRRVRYYCTVHTIIQLISRLILNNTRYMVFPHFFVLPTAYWIIKST
jgi:hypothetical protein